MSHIDVAVIVVVVGLGLAAIGLRRLLVMVCVLAVAVAVLGVGAALLNDVDEARPLIENSVVLDTLAGVCEELFADVSAQPTEVSGAEPWNQ